MKFLLLVLSPVQLSSMIHVGASEVTARVAQSMVTPACDVALAEQLFRQDIYRACS